MRLTVSESRRRLKCVKFGYCATIGLCNFDVFIDIIITTIPFVDDISCFFDAIRHRQETNRACVPSEPKIITPHFSVFLPPKIWEESETSLMGIQHSDHLLNFRLDKLQSPLKVSHLRRAFLAVWTRRQVHCPRFLHGRGDVHDKHCNSKLQDWVSILGWLGGYLRRRVQRA